jgi:putative nucleotide binding protein
MSDPRRKRQIKSPSGPRKKATQDLSKYWSAPTTGRQEVPKPQPKPDPSKQRKQGGQGGGRSGERRQGGRGQGRRGQGNRGQGRQNQSRPEPEALKTESWARVLEHDVKGGVATAMAEKSLAFCRLKVKGSDLMPINQRIYIGKDRSKRTEVLGILGMAHLDKMSNMARQDMPSLVQMFVEEHGQYFVDEFYNKAGPMSLKQHSYELLPDVGPVKARNMVKARDQVGVFASMDELNALAKIKGAELLAQRFVEEMEDKTLVPRLTELLLPVEA